VDEDPTNTIIDKNGTLVVKQTAENQKEDRGTPRQPSQEHRHPSRNRIPLRRRRKQLPPGSRRRLARTRRQLGGEGVPGKGTSAPFDDFGQPGATSVLGSDNLSGAY
jgi:hypothetical protein